MPSLSSAYDYSAYESWPEDTRTLRTTFAIHVRETFTKSQLKRLASCRHGKVKQQLPKNESKDDSAHNLLLTVRELQAMRRDQQSQPQPFLSTEPLST
jgi:hypothetical protein